MAELTARLKDLTDLIASLSLQDVDRAQNIAETIGAHERFVSEEDLVLAIARLNNPTALISAASSSTHHLTRPEAKAIIEGAREDRANELTTTVTPAQSSAAPLGSTNNPLVLARTYPDMSEVELIQVLAAVEREDPKAIAIMLEMETRPILRGLSIYIPTSEGNHLDGDLSVGAFTHAQRNNGVAPKHFGPTQQATYTLQQYLFGGTPVDPITGEVLEDGFGPKSRAHWSSVPLNRLVLVTYIRLSGGLDLPPAMQIVQETNSTVPDKALNPYWQAARSAFQKDRTLRPGLIASAYAALVLNPDGGAASSATSFR